MPPPLAAPMPGSMICGVLAVASIRSGDDIKTVQGDPGHAAASFPPDVYGHVTTQRKQASAARMEEQIKSVSGG